MRFALIDAEKAEFPVRTMCRVLDVSESGFFSWKGRPASQRQRDDMIYLAHIRIAFELSNRTYGSPRMHRDLVDEGLSIGRRRTARLMRENGLAARQKRRFKRTTDSTHAWPVAPNLLDQDFAAEAPDQKWSADISYIWTAEGWLYLAVLIDLFSRRVVGWAVSDRLKKDLALRALRMALVTRHPPSGLIHHSDRGSQGGFNRSSQHVQFDCLQALVQSFGGSSPSEGLAGPCIERVSNNCEYVRTVCAQIGSFREVLSKQSIGVLVRSALPRAVRFAEVDGKAGCDPQIRMPGHLCSLVPGQRAAKLRWQCRDRPGDGIANRFSPMTGKRRPVLHARDGAVAFHSGKMQQHCEPRGAFHQSADRRSAQADDQVTFPVSGYGPISCFRRSFTDHDLRRDEGFAPPAATCPRHAQCPSRAKAGGQLTTECAAALYVERLIDRLMTDPHRLILGPVPRIVDPKTVRDLLRTPGPGPSPVLPRPMPTTVPDDAWPLDHRSIRCRDPTRKPILHIAPQRLIRCQLGWLRPFGGSISMPLRRRCSVVQATASGRRVAPHLAGDRRRCSLQPASNMTYASSLGAQKSNLLTFLERQVTS